MNLPAIVLGAIALYLWSRKPENKPISEPIRPIPVPNPGGTEKPRPKWSIVGDSHVEGLGPALRKYARVDALAKRGANVGDFLTKFKSEATEVARRSPVTIVCLGANDRPVPVDVRRLYGELMGPRREVIWLTVPADTMRANPSLQAARVPLIEWTAIPELIRDGVHLTKEGYETWATIIAAELLNR